MVRIAISTEGEVRASDGAIDVQQVARVEVHNVAAVDGASIGQQDVARLRRQSHQRLGSRLQVKQRRQAQWPGRW